MRSEPRGSTPWTTTTPEPPRLEHSSTKVSDQAFAYLPIDRRVALSRGQDIPGDVWGSALEADLSGFTALTEGLAEQLGEQRGAEELARRLNVLYDGLLAELHSFGGTVLGFSGDAFTCWFDGDDGVQATACALAQQEWMTESAATSAGSLAVDLPPPRLKVAVATGRTRRFLVGDPDIQVIEGLAGSLVDELAAIEHGAEPGEVVLAESTRQSLGDRVEVGERGVLRRLAADAVRVPWPELDEDANQVDLVRPWLLRPVFERLQAGAGDFIAELRPVTALFLRFGGIAFDGESIAIDQLDSFVKEVQCILSDVEATLVQLTIGDKGAYLYAAFGAPIAHEDDPARAILAALRLRELGAPGGLVSPVSIGIASGRLRAGAYGGSQRRTYGVLGDTVNLSARLMQAAQPGEILATDEVRAATRSAFDWADHDDLTVKGKRLPVRVSTLLGSATVSASQGGRADDLQMLGREGDLAALVAALDDAINGNGSVVAVTGEAGLGKSRLVAEFVTAARARDVDAVIGECPSYGVASNYVVWRAMWTHLLDLAELPIDDWPATLPDRLAADDPTLANRAPLLSALLSVDVPDNQLTRGFDAKTRKTSLEATLVAWLQSARSGPRLLVLEDCHWIDPLSEDLLHAVGRAVRSLPILVVITHRPRGETEGGALSVSALPHYRALELQPLADAEVEELIAAHLGSTGARSIPVDAAIAALAARAEGNPFFAREIAGYIVGLGAAAADPERLAEMPTSLQSLVLSRIDRLSEQPRTTLRVAGAVGRRFRSGVVASVQPELGGDEAVHGHLAVLERDAFVTAEADNSDAFSFVHAVTQEVAYSTLTLQTRAWLHGRIGSVFEQRGEASLDVLAYHFGRGDDDERRRRYVLAAAEASKAVYANAAAVAYYRNVLPLLDGDQRHEAMLGLGRTLALLADWSAADEVFEAARVDAVAAGSDGHAGWAELERGELSRKQGRYDDALPVLDAAYEKLSAVADDAGIAEVLHCRATLAAQRGDLDTARTSYEESLRLRTQLGDRRGMARSLNGLGIVAEYADDLDAASQLYTRALEILTELDDAWGRSALTNNLGMARLLQDDPGGARPYFEVAVDLQREIGDPLMLANFLSNLGDASRELDDDATAGACYDESLQLADQVDELWLIAYLLEDVAMLAAARAEAAPALTLAAAGARLRDEIGTPIPPQVKQRLDDRLATASAALTADDIAAAERAGAALQTRAAIGRAREVISRIGIASR